MNSLTRSSIDCCVIIAMSLACCFLTQTIHAQELPAAKWNQFRGPNGTGLSAGGKPPVKFDLNTNLCWSTPLPAGHSSPVIWGNRIFITGIQDKTFETICVDRTTGKILWRKPGPQVEFEAHHPENSPATSTPYVDADRVYVYFGSFGLLCYDQDGNDVWQLPVPTPKNIHGTATSPVGYRNLLYLIHDSMDGDSYVLAVEKATGREAWKARRPFRNPNWSTPVIWQKEGGDELIVLGGGILQAYEPLTGKPLWSVGGFGHSIPVPVVGEDVLYASTASGEEAGEPNSLLRWKTYKKYDTNTDGRVHVSEIPETDITIMYKEVPDARFPTRTVVSWFDRDHDNAFTQQELQQFLEAQNLNVRSCIAAIRPHADGKSGDEQVGWKYERSIPHKASCLAVDGKIYMFRDGGVVTCLDAATGRQQYQSRFGRGYYSSSPIYANGNIYVCSRDGVVSVLQIGDRLKTVSQNDLGEPIVATPAISGDMLIVRTGSHLYAFAPTADR